MTGDDARIGIELEVDADAAASEVEDQFVKALTSAINSAQVKSAFQNMAKQAGDAFKQGFGGKGGADPFDNLKRQAQQSAKDQANAWKYATKVFVAGQKTMQAQAKQTAAAYAAAGTAVTASARVQAAQQKAAAAQAKQAAAQVTASATQMAAQAQIRAAQISGQHGREVALIQERAALELSAQRRRLETYRQLWRQVVLIEKAIAAAVRAGAKVAYDAVKAMARGIGALLRGVGKAFSNIFSRRGGDAGLRELRGAGNERVSLWRRIFRRENQEIQSGLRQQTRMQQRALQEQSRALQSFQARQQRGLAGVLSGRSAFGQALGVGGVLGGGAGLMSLITGGFERASSLERLQAQFTAMLGSGEEATALIERIDAFARKTPFDLVGTADLARSFLAMGQNADQSLASISTLADAVAFTGGTSENLDRVRVALQQIFSAGRLQGDEFNQLAENLGGIDVRGIIADQLGVTTPELIKMQENGELTAEVFMGAFLGALESDPRIAGSAEALSQTLAGRLANLKEAWQAFGGQIIGLVAGPLRSAFLFLNNIFEKFGDFVSGENLSGPMMRLRDILGDIAKGLGIAAAIKGFGEALRFLAIGLRAVLSPLGLLLTAVAALAVVWGQMMDASEPLRTAVSELATSLGALFTSIQTLGVNAFNALFGAITGKTSTFKTLGDAAAGFVEQIQRAIDKVNEWVSLIAGAFAPTPRARTQQENPFETIAAQDPNQLISSNLLPEAARVQLLEGTTGLPFTPMVAASDAVDIWNQFMPTWWQGAEEALAGETPAAKARAEIMKRLEGSFLGPLIRAFRSAAPTLQGAAGFIGRAIRAIGEAIVTAWTWVVDRVGPIVGSIRDFLTGLWDVIFDTGQQGGLTGAVDEFFGSGQSLGERLFAFFFEDGPLAGVMTTMRNLWDSVYEFFTPAVQAIGDVLSSVWKVVKPIIQPLIDAISGLFDAFKNMEFPGGTAGKIGVVAGGAGALALLASYLGPFGLLLLGGGALTALLAKTSLGPALVETITNAIDTVWPPVKAAFEGLWEDITGWLSDQFTPGKLADYGLAFLGLVEGIGNAIGSIVTDPKFLAAVFALGIGLAAAAVSIVGAFVLGFSKAMADNIGELAGYIRDGLQSAWENLKLSFIPDPIQRAIESLLGNAAVASGISFLAIGLAAKIFTEITAALAKRSAAKVAAGGNAGGSFSFTGLGQAVAGGIVGSISRAFTALWRGGAAIFTNNQKFVGGGIGGAGNPFQKTGQAIGGALAAGVAIGFTGYAAGRSGSTGGVILSILGGAGAGAAIGTAIAPGLGTVIGTVLGGGIAALGAAFGASGAAAEKAAGQIREYTDALNGLEGSDAATALSDVLFEQLQKEQPETQRFLEDYAGINTRAMAEAILAGQHDVDSAFSQLMGNAVAALSSDPNANFDAVLILSELEGAINAAIALGENIDTDWLYNLVATTPGAADALAALGFQGNTLQEVFDFIADESGEAAEGIVDLQREAAAKAAPDGINSISDAVKAVNDALADGATATEISKILSDSSLTTTEQMEALAEATDSVTQSADEARRALVDVFGGANADTDTDIFRGFRIDARRLNDQVAGIADGVDFSALGNAARDEIEEALDGSSAIISDALSEAVNNGLVVDQGSFDSFVEQMRSEINSLDVSDEVKAALLGQLDEIIGSDDVTALLAGLEEGIRNDTTLEAAAAALAQRVQAALVPQRGGGISGVISSFFSRGDTATGSGGGGAGAAGATQYATGFESGGNEIQTSIRTTVSDAFGGAKIPLALAATTTGFNTTKQFAGGMTAAASQSQAAGGKVAASAIAGAATGNVAMYLTGINLANSLASGIRAGAAAAAVAAAAAAYAVSQAARRALGIRSPSKVFADIGKQVGEGFAEGIKDSETSMSNALEEALTGAIEKATEAAGKAVRTARVGEQIFGLLVPSNIPGGTSLAETALQNIELWQNVRGTLADLRTQAGESLGARTSGGLFAPSTGISLAVLNFREAFDSLTKEVAAARATAGAERTIRQRDLISTGAATLSAAHFAGAENREAFAAGLTAIAEWGQAATAAGAATSTVVSTMSSNVKQLVDMGVALGLNRATLEAIVSQFNLSAAQLNAWRTSLTDLSTEAGWENIAKLTGQLQSIREFGTALIGSGTPIAAAVTSMKNLRNELIRQATSFGFNGTQLAALVEQVGLTDAALAEFIKQMQDFEKAAAAAGQATASATSQDRLDRPNIEATINIQAPYGNAEALGLSVLNQWAYQVG